MARAAGELNETVNAPEPLSIVAPDEPEPTLNVPASFQILTTVLLVSKSGSAEDVVES